MAGELVGLARVDWRTVACITDRDPDSQTLACDNSDPNEEENRATRAR